MTGGKIKKVFSYFVIVSLFSTGIYAKDKEEHGKEINRTIISETVILVSFSFDSIVRDYIQGHRTKTIDTIANFTNNFGDGEILAAFLVAAGSAGLLFRHKKLLRTTIEAGESFVIAGGITNVIKTIAMRKRPYDSSDPFSFKFGKRSFPSGHVAVSAAVSTVFAKEYKCPVLYIIPLLTAYARVEKDAHWFSDTVAAFVLGYFTASWVVKK